jgi:hypothetical protein
MPIRPPRAKQQSAKRSTYSPETRAAALAALLAGQSVSKVAEEYNLPKGTVSNWKLRTAIKLVPGGAASSASSAETSGESGSASPASPPSPSAGGEDGETQKGSGGDDGGSGGKQSIGDLLIQLLESNIRGLISASSVLRDQAWVRQQGAAELGTLIGITHDKVIRMLEAMDRASAPPPPAPLA